MSREGIREILCAVPREWADRQHTALTTSARHPHIRVCSRQLNPPHQSSSYWKQQGKLQRTRHKLHLQVPWPLHGLPAQQETDMRKHSTALALFRNKSSLLLTHMLWSTLESPRFPRMSSVFWKLLLPEQGWAAPAELQDTTVLPLSECTQTSHSSWCTNLHNCSGGAAPGWLHQFSRSYSERKRFFCLEDTFQYVKGAQSCLLFPVLCDWTWLSQLPDLPTNTIL